MKRFKSILIVLASLACGRFALAAARPHYGGTLHISIQESPESLDPASSDSPALRSLSQLVYETLIHLDDRGRPQPRLASAWQAEPGDQRWRFQVRSGVIFSDGTPLDANTVAAALRTSNPHWKVFALGDLVMIETDAPDSEVAAELALQRNSILHRSKGEVIGTGPFTAGQLDQAAKHLTLTANDQYWGGRPFVDSIEIDFARNYRDQMMNLDLGKSDLIEIAPEAIRMTQSDTRRLLMSSPEELLCLFFARDAQSDAEVHLRTALARSIDTAALNNVVFQAGGEPTGALLPNWLSGYAFVFPSGGSAAAGLREKSPQQHVTWTLSFDAADPTARIVADRIQLNARDAGITLQTGNSDNADLRLMRVPLPSLDAQIALAELARDLQLAPPTIAGNSVGALYSAESALLQTRRVIPLLHLRSGIALRPNIRGVSIHPDGTWALQDASFSFAPETL